MTIRFSCPECESVLKIKDELAGTAARCPKCKTKFVVPQPADELPSKGHETEGASASTKSSATESEHHPVASAGLSSIEIPAQGAETSDSASDVKSPQRTSEVAEEVPVKAAIHREQQETDESSSNSSDDFHLQLDDNEEEPPSKIPVAEQRELVTAPVNGSTAEQAADEDLDCQPMLVSSFLVELKSGAEVVIESKKPTTSRLPPEYAADFVARSPRIPTPVRNEEAPVRREPIVVPMDYLADEAPPRTPVSLPAVYPKPPDSDADLSLSDESDYEIPAAPTPQPINRRTPAASAARPDYASAAKMLKKAIKDSQADASRQRELDAKPGYDYFLFFREFGLRGLMVLIAAVVGPVAMYYAFDYMLSSSLKTPKLGYVTGTVKLDGKPAANVIVFMAPSDTAIASDKRARERARTSVGVTNDAGEFKMMYAPKIEGVAAGKCSYWLSGNAVPADWSEAAKRVAEISEGRQKTPFEINMESKKK